MRRSVFLELFFAFFYNYSISWKLYAGSSVHGSISKFSSLATEENGKSLNLRKSIFGKHQNNLWCVSTNDSSKNCFELGITHAVIGTACVMLQEKQSLSHCLRIAVWVLALWLRIEIPSSPSNCWKEKVIVLWLKWKFPPEGCMCRGRTPDRERRRCRWGRRWGTRGSHCCPRGPPWSGWNTYLDKKQYGSFWSKIT